MAGKTRKHRQGQGRTRKQAVHATTIPELKRSFDALEAAVANILSSKAVPKQRVKKFQEEWRKIFGRPVEAAAAEAYLQVKARTHMKHGKTRKASQKGGGALSGAPVDFMTRPGVDGVYGSFNQYLTSGLSFYNTINQEAMFKDCGVKDITPAVPASMGSNQAGGGTIADAAAVLTARPVPSSAPPSSLFDLQTYWQGRPLGASPAPEQNPNLKL